MTRSARLKAFAKVNLGLRVLYRRPDGYHELRTVFQTISLADRIDVAFTPARRTRIGVAGAQIENNIMVRAAERVLSALKIQGTVEFMLAKKIPAGAGLGGGSADAGAVLLSLPVLAGRALPAASLRAIAAELGSDVPFFLCGGTAVGLGRGEELYPLDAAPQGAGLLVTPEIHSSTADAYRDLSGTLSGCEEKRAQFEAHAWSGALPDWTNDFEPVVFARHPELKRVRERLRKLGAVRVAMTGSGSSVVALFADAAGRQRALAHFPADRAHAISFVSRAQYRAAWNKALRPHTKGDQWPPRSLFAR